MNKPDNDVIERVWAGLSSPKQAKEVAEWLATEEGQEFFSKHFDQEAEKESDFLADLIIDHQIPTEEMLHNIEARLKKRKILTYVWRIAAMVIPFVLLIGMYVQLESRIDFWGNSEYDEVHVPRGERMQMMFQDGTRVYLNSDSYLKYPRKFGLNRRQVELHGEAYFKVAKNTYRPFVVKFDKSSIKVLGTSFNVNAYPDEERIVIHLDEGKIEVAFESDKKVQVSPGESLIYDKETNLFRIKKMNYPKLTSAWKENIIAFREEPICNVLTKLERWFDVRFINVGNIPKNIFITLESKNSSLHEILKDLGKITNMSFHYNKERKEVLVK